MRSNCSFTSKEQELSISTISAAPAAVVHASHWEDEQGLASKMLLAKVNGSQCATGNDINDAQELTSSAVVINVTHNHFCRWMESEIVTTPNCEGEGRKDGSPTCKFKVTKLCTTKKRSSQIRGGHTKNLKNGGVSEIRDTLGGPS